MSNEQNYATVLTRIVAKGLDFLLVIAVVEVIPKIGFYIGALYLLAGDSFFDRRSIGKRLLGLKVLSIKEEGKSSPIKDSILRNITVFFSLLLWAIPLIGWIFLAAIIIIEVIIMMGNEEKMRIGDEIAGTIVIEATEEKVV